MDHKLLSQRLKPFGFADLYKKRRIFDLSADQRSVLYSFLFVAFWCLLSVFIWEFSFPVLVVFYISHMLSKLIFGVPPFIKNKKEGLLQSKLSNKVYPELHHFFFCVCFVLFLTISSLLLSWATGKVWESFALSLIATYVLSRGILIAWNVPLVSPIFVSILPYLNRPVHPSLRRKPYYNDPNNPLSPLSPLYPLNRRDF